MRILAAILALAAVSQTLEAAELSAQERTRAETLIAGLGSDGFETREASDRALRSLGEPVLPILRDAMSSDDPEIRLRAGALVAQIDPARRPLLSVWYLSIQCDNEGLFEDNDDDGFRIRRAEIAFDMDLGKPTQFWTRVFQFFQ